MRFVSLLLFVLLMQTALSKFKSLHCTSIDKDYGDFTECKINAVNRIKNTMNIIYLQKQRTDDIVVRIQFLKRANGWRPFLYDFKSDLCKFMVKPNNMVVKLIYSYFQKYSNINFTCPVPANTQLIVRNFELNVDNLRLQFPIENGEYGIHATYYSKKKIRLTLNGSIYYSNYKEI